MSSQVQIDLDELVTFINALKTFNAALDANWETTKARWQSLLHTWQDPECANFLDAVGWLNVQLKMQKYLDNMSSYVFWLEQHAQPLMTYRGRTSVTNLNIPPSNIPTPPITPRPRPVEKPETGGGSPERGG